VVTVGVFRAITTLAFLAGFVLACDDPVSTESTSVGLYELIMFEGIPVPGILLQSGDFTFEMLSGEFLINADATCSEIWNLRVTEGGEVTNSDFPWECTWTEEGTAISFTGSAEIGGSWVGSILEDQLTVTHFLGVVCIRAPCPSHYTAIYERVSGA
jgi:hypothetical protein